MTLGISSRENEDTQACNYMYNHVQGSQVHYSPNWKVPRCPLTGECKTKVWCAYVWNKILKRKEKCSETRKMKETQKSNC